MNRILGVAVLALMLTMVAVQAWAGDTYRETLISLSNHTTTATTSKSLRDTDKWDCRVVMNNFSGTVALDLSWDSGTTWVNRTTVSTGTSAFNIVSYATEIATDIRVVTTDTFYNITGSEEGYTHTTPGIELELNHIHR